MKTMIQENRAEFARLLSEIKATSKDGAEIDFDEGMAQSVDTILAMQQSGGKLIWVGNGGSAAIASHMATDFLKNAGMAATAFNDGSLLTCLSNDLGYENVFSTPINHLAKPEDVLVAISSSGKSQSILNAVSAAREHKLKVITLSGFGESNPLRQTGDINFYVPSNHYGHVEDIHQSIGHCWIDVIMQQNN